MSSSNLSIYESYVPAATRREQADLKVRQMLAQARGNLTADFAGVTEDSLATLLWKLKTGHNDIRTEKVSGLKSQIQNRTYSEEDKIDIAVDRLLDVLASLHISV